MMKWILTAAIFLAIASTGSAEPQAALRPSGNRAIEDTFHALYNFHFAKARNTIQFYIAKHPGDPLGYSVLAAVGLFQELDRLSILEGEFFKDDDKIKDKKKLKPDPALRSEIYDNIAKAQQIALSHLKRDANDTNALFTMTMTEGMTLDYMALVEKRQAASLKYARSAQSYAVRTLAVDPEFYDVYCTTGFSEYLLGSIPFFLRWFIKFDDTEGSKEAGLRKLQIAATKGNYFKPFSKLLLAIFYLRQEEPAMSERYLAQFEAAYPENPLVKRERKKLAKMIAAIAAEQGK
ncbi:MAG: hypothetical protein IT169_12475 [Bryobacterales bacterium]|nr:hypothetical protein [Bryobacterales bacterium]